MLPAEGTVADRVTLYEEQQEIARKKAMLAAAPQYTAAPTVRQVLQGASMPPPPYTPAPEIPAWRMNAPQMAALPTGANYPSYQMPTSLADKLRGALGGVTSSIGRVGDIQLPERFKAQNISETVTAPIAVRTMLAGSMLGTEAPPGYENQSLSRQDRLKMLGPAQTGGLSFEESLASWRKLPPEMQAAQGAFNDPANLLLGGALGNQVVRGVGYGVEFAGGAAMKDVAGVVQALGRTTSDAFKGWMERQIAHPQAEEMLGVPRSVVQGMVAEEAPKVQSLAPTMDELARMTPAEKKFVMSEGLRGAEDMMSRGPSPITFTELNTMTPDQVIARVGEELERIAKNEPISLVERAKRAAISFVNPEAAKDENYLMAQVWQNRLNRRMGAAWGDIISEWEKSNKQLLFRVDKNNNILTIPEEAGLSRQYGDVMENPSRYVEWLTPEQTAFVQKRGETWNKLANWYEDMTHEEFPRRLGNEYYSPRHVLEEEGLPAKGPTNPFEERKYSTVAGGQEAGVVYAVDDPAVVASHVRYVYNKAADVTMGREYATKIGIRPIDRVAPELLEDTRVAKVALTETRNAVRAEVNEAYATQQAVISDLEKERGFIATNRSPDVKAAYQQERQAQKAWAEVERPLTSQSLEVGPPELQVRLATGRTVEVPARKADLWTEYQRLRTERVAVRKAALENIDVELIAERAKLKALPHGTNAVEKSPDVLQAKIQLKTAASKASKAKLQARTKAGVGYQFVRGRVGGGRIFRDDIAKAIMERYGVPETPNGIRTLSNILFSPMRAVRATADYGVMFIQGWDPLMINPKDWSVGMSRGLHDVARDQGRRAQYIEANMDVIGDMIKHGWKPRGAEFGMGSLGMHGLPVIGKPLQIFDELFSHPMNITAVELNKSGRQIYRLTGADETELQALTDVINNLTGSVKYGGGVNEDRVFFAARFLRSQIALAADAFKPGMRGTVARQLFATMFTFAGSATILINEAMGEPWTLNLLDPKGFTVRIGDKHVSLLGPGAPLLRGFAHLVTGDPLYLVTRTGRGKLAPGLSNIVDLLVGENFLGQKVDVTNAKGFLSYVLQQVTPMSSGEAGGALKGIPNPFGGSVSESGGAWKDIARRATEGALALSGARAFPLSDWDKKMEAQRQMFKGRSGDELTKTEAEAFDKAHPEFKEAEGKRTAEEYAKVDQKTVVLQLTNVARDAFQAELEKVPSKASPEAQKEAYQSARDAFGATLSTLRVANPEVFADWDKKVKVGDPETPEEWTREQVYKGYTSIFTQFEDPDTHRVPSESKDEMGLRLDEYMADLTETQASQLLEDMGAKDTPWLSGYRADMRDLKPSYDNRDKIWLEFAKRDSNLKPFANYSDYYDSVLVDYQKRGLSAAEAAQEPAVKAFTRFAEPRNQDFDLRNPRLAAIRAYWSDGVVHSRPAAEEYHTMYKVWPRLVLP